VSSWTNKDRAARGRAILDHYADVLGGERDAGDLVADVLHYIHSPEAASEDKQWPEAINVLDSARMHFEEEIAEEEDTYAEHFEEDDDDEE